MLKPTIKSQEILARWIDETKRRGRWFRLTTSYSGADPRFFSSYRFPALDHYTLEVTEIVEVAEDSIVFLADEPSNLMANDADQYRIDATDPVQDRLGNTLHWWDGDPVLSGTGHVLYGWCSADGWDDFVSSPFRGLIEEFLPQDKVADYRDLFDWLGERHHNLVAVTVSEEDASPGCERDSQHFYTSTHSPSDPIWEEVLADYAAR